MSRAATETRLAQLDALNASGRPLNIRLDDAGWLMIDWADGHVGRFRPTALRRECPCAACIDEVSGERKLDPASVPEDLAITEVAGVGHYAIKITYSDGHGSGLQTFERLRHELCQCPGCEQQRKVRWEV